MFGVVKAPFPSPSPQSGERCRGVGFGQDLAGTDPSDEVDGLVDAIHDGNYVYTMAGRIRT